MTNAVILSVARTPVATAFKGSLITTAPEKLARHVLTAVIERAGVEGAEIEILHEGLIGGDPIAIRVDDMNVALRRREANAILVRAYPVRPSGKAQG